MRKKYHKMLLQRLAKASNASTSPMQSKSKRATLSVFSQLREAEELSDDYRSSDEEIELNQDFFREFTENSPKKALKMMVSKIQIFATRHPADRLSLF